MARQDRAHMKSPTAPLIEALESRIAPATLLPGGKVVTFTDVDGDLVTVKFSKPILTAANVASIFTFTGSAFGDSGPQQLSVVDLDEIGATANGMDITVTAKRGTDGAGNNEVSFHALNASNVNTSTGMGTGIDLGKVKIGGHINYIDVGDGNVTTPAAKSISVLSLGQNQHAISSVIHGAVAKITVRGAVYGNLVAKSDVANSPQQTRIGALDIGSLVGSDAVKSGRIEVGDVGKLTIRGNIVGGEGNESGVVLCRNVDSFSIQGSIVGSESMNSGRVLATSVEKTSIGGSVVGGDGMNSGLFITGSGKFVKVGGSVIGGQGNFSGTVAGPGLSVFVGGSVIGGAGELSGNVSGNSGALKTVTVAGSLSGGSDDFSGRIAGTSIDRVFIGGDIIGGGGDLSGTISGSGELRMVRGSILGGPSSSDSPHKAAGIYGDSGNINRIVIGGDVVDANIIVGVTPTNNQFGDADDAAISVPNIGKIGTLIIKGHVGSAMTGPTFGIEAKEIASVSIGGVKFINGKGGVNFQTGFLPDPSAKVKVRVI